MLASFIKDATNPTKETILQFIKKINKTENKQLTFIQVLYNFIQLLSNLRAANSIRIHRVSE